MNVLLHTLPESHPDRNRKLLGAWYSNKGGKSAREVLSSFKIASVTYNDLGSAWTETSDFWFQEDSASA